MAFLTYVIIKHIYYLKLSATPKPPTIALLRKRYYTKLKLNFEFFLRSATEHCTKIQPLQVFVGNSDLPTTKPCRFLRPNCPPSLKKFSALFRFCGLPQNLTRRIFSRASNFGKSHTLYSISNFLYSPSNPLYCNNNNGRQTRVFLVKTLFAKEIPHTSHGKFPLHSICRHCCCLTFYVTHGTSCLLLNLIENLKLCFAGRQNSISFVSWRRI